MYKKYDSRKLEWCMYPFENEPLGYCWGYAGFIDNSRPKKDIKKYCKYCDMNKYYKEKYETIFKM